MPNFTCVNKRRRIFLSLSKLECGLQINARKIRLHLTFSANRNKLDRVSGKREFIFKVAFSLPSPSSMLKLPILIGGDSVSIALPQSCMRSARSDQLNLILHNIISHPGNAKLRLCFDGIFLKKQRDIPPVQAIIGSTPPPPRY